MKTAVTATRHRAFTGEWMPRFAVCVLDITVWGVVLARVSGLSEPICFGMLTLLAIALALLCAVVSERNAQKAAILSDCLLYLPVVVALGLIGWAAWLALWPKLAK